MLKLKHQLRYFDGLGSPIIALSQKIRFGFFDRIQWAERKLKIIKNGHNLLGIRMIQIHLVTQISNGFGGVVLGK